VELDFITPLRPFWKLCNRQAFHRLDERCFVGELLRLCHGHSYSACKMRLLYELSRGYAQAVCVTVPAMDYARLETATLAHVDDSYYYGAYCRKCKHSARLSLSKLRAHLGETFPLLKIKDKLRCECCSSRQIVITFLAPDQRTGNLVELFSRKPG
jgi:hypothetical protein